MYRLERRPIGRTGNYCWVWHEGDSFWTLDAKPFAALVSGSDRGLPCSQSGRRGLRHIQPTTIRNRADLGALTTAGMLDADRAFTGRAHVLRAIYRKDFANG